MELNKRGLLILLAGFVLVGLLALASAAKDDNASAGDDASKVVEKNMTYGQCVSEAAGVKNTCYKATKLAYASCSDAAKNQTDAKNARNQCRTTYKKDMKQCKTDFKGTKKQVCARIKHNFFETLGSSLK